MLIFVIITLEYQFTVVVFLNLQSFGVILIILLCFYLISSTYVTVIGHFIKKCNVM